MADRQYTAYQQKAIRSFYDNRDTSDQQRLGELVADLYLANEKKGVKLWAAAQEIMVRLGVPSSRIDHVMKSANPAILAEVVNDVHAGKIKKPVPAKPTQQPTDS
jgi:hypothetical protein